MSYPMDLDEYDSDRLEAELTRRKLMRENGLCDYCNRARNCVPSCKFPERHNEPVVQAGDKCSKLCSTPYCYRPCGKLAGHTNHHACDPL